VVRQVALPGTTARGGGTVGIPDGVSINLSAAHSWLPKLPVSAILAYIEKHREFDEDLFGPAFILDVVAPEHPEPAAILARLSETVRALLDLATPPRP
jgi:hypothetical protein